MKDDLQELRDLAQKLDLAGKQLLTDTPDEIVEKVCNGIGPSWFPSNIRKAIDRLHPSLKVVAMIHDLAYYFGTGTDDDFKKANADFATNGCKVAEDRYVWYDPRRYLARHSARKFAALCAAFGRLAYINAQREREADENASIRV